MTTTKRGYLCRRCGHTTFPKKPGKPRICGGCKSPKWETAERIRAPGAGRPRGGGKGSPR